ncbi:ABEC4 enzyme, partial [Ceuthmochares aereus]|nr:ABEC4 enzyme [Ceuthmochares aereus]
KPIFREYLTNQGSVVKPYFWQRQNHICSKCPYHIRTGEEARVHYAEVHRVFGFPHRSTATPQNKHLLFYELRSFSGKIVQKGHATNCADQDKHPESMLFEVGGYLDAVTGACENIRCIILYSNYSPCNEASHCCVSKIYNFLLKYPETTLCIYFSQLYHTEDGFPTAAWNREALWSLRGLWPRVTLQRLPGEGWPSLLRHFAYGIPGSTLSHPTPLLRTTADGQNPQRIHDLRGRKPHFSKAFPQAAWGKAFSFPNPASRQPFQVPKGSLLPLRSESCLVVFPGKFLPFQRECLSPRPKNIVRHLKMPKE